MMTIPKLRTKSFSYKPWRRAPRLDLSTLLASLPLLLFPVLSPAQSIEEEIPIVPGWNAISIEVDPDDPSPAAVFAGVSVESVWTFLGPRDGEAGAGGRWLVCHVGSPSVVDSLFSIQGGRVYLIRATANGMLRLRGRPLHRERPLHGGRFELTGLPIDAASPPTLGEYLSRASTSESVDAVYELSAGTYRPVLEGASLRAGAGYWVLASRDIADVRPLRSPAGAASLLFDETTSACEIDIEVTARPVARKLTLRPRESIDGSKPEWLEIESAPGVWRSLESAVDVSIPAGASVVRVALRPARSSALLALAGGAGVASEGSANGVIEIVGPEGSRLDLGARLVLSGVHGLWIGEAIVSRVSRPEAYGGGLAAAPEAPVALILSIPDDGGPPRLLDHAALPTTRDGRDLVHRFTATLFPRPVTLSGTIESSGTSGVLTGSVTLGAEDPLNPYRHRYHPEHGDGYRVDRTFTLRLLPEDPDPTRRELSLTPVGQLIGSYEEEIRGLSLDPIRVRGTFRLRRVASLDEVILD